VAKIGTKARPAILRVRTMARAEQVAATCGRHGIQFILGVEPDKPEDISDLDRALQVEPSRVVVKVGRNEPCPCGSGRKFKRCCALASA
jgi:SWIM/SEC-C metal-binding protein